MSTRRTAGIVGGLLGAAATAGALGVARHRRKVAKERAAVAVGASLEPTELGVSPRGREWSVAGDDDVVLSVEELGPADGGRPELTVVLVHGFALDRRCWHFQRRALAALTDPRVRILLYDQRSHGRSGRGPKASCTIDALARDLAAVLQAAAPEGPLVLVGHSMGGMTVMGLAELDPGLFAERVAGVALLSTSAAGIASTGLPRVVLSARNPLVAGLGLLAAWQPGLVEGARRLGADLAWTIVKAYSYGDRAVRPALVDLVDSMIAATPVEVLTAFVPALSSHDRVAALAALSTCEVLVVSGDADRLIPFSHSELIAGELPDARLLRLAGAGHMAMLEQPEVLEQALVGLLHRAAARLRGSRRPGVTLRLPSTADTEALGRRIGARLAAGDVVVLAGPLGAGKTVLARGIAAGMGVVGAVTSPTFVIAREHRPGAGGTGVALVHVDAYRLGGLDELDELDLDTDLAQAAVVVEWGEGLAERLAPEHLLVRLSRRAQDEERVAELVGPPRLLP